MSIRHTALSAGSVLVAAALSLVPAAAAHAQNDTSVRLVVVLTVDQLRGDYLERFRPYFGAGGFQRLLTQGAVFTNAVYEHAVTKTCPGHAVVLTGTHAADNGVISNEWWNRATGRIEYCAFDAAAPLVGTEGEGRSPRRLRVPTLGDVLKLANGRSRVVSVAGKDRSAIMVGGQLADAAWWAHDTLFVTSRYYADSLPSWVRRFNASRAFTRYHGTVWDRLAAPSVHASLGADNVPGERDKAGMGLTFPHAIGAGEERPGPRFVEALEYSPFHDDVVLDFALQAMRAERLGLDDAPDILAIGLSATDRVGHAFGPDSHEMFDMMIRTDRRLMRLFDALEQDIGMDHVLLVLTSDHGVAPLPETIQRHRSGTAAVRIPTDSVAALVERGLVSRFGGEGWVSNADAPYIYLDRATAQECAVDVREAADHARDVLLQQHWIRTALTHAELSALQASGARTPLALSFSPVHSGDVMYAQVPWVVIQGDTDGTTHGSQWLYDRHVPVIFLGNGITPGTHTGHASVADIASTLAAVLRLPPPPAASGRVLFEVLDRGAEPGADAGRPVRRDARLAACRPRACSGGDGEGDSMIPPPEPMVSCRRRCARAFSQCPQQPCSTTDDHLRLPGQRSSRRSPRRRRSPKKGDPRASWRTTHSPALRSRRLTRRRHQTECGLRCLTVSTRARSGASIEVCGGSKLKATAR